MPLKNPHQRSQGGTFTQIGTEPLSKKVRGVRLPQSIDDELELMPTEERASFIRAAIVQAVQQKRALQDPSLIEVEETD